jgi:hypothetical protein
MLLETEEVEALLVLDTAGYSLRTMNQNCLWCLFHFFFNEISKVMSKNIHNSEMPFCVVCPSLKMDF